MIIWSLLRFAFGLPPALSVANRARRREKGYAALSRGIIAVGTGDVRLASKAAAEVQKHLPGEPLALLLKAEAAQLAGDLQAVEAAFKEMTRRHDMRLLGFRGLHAQAHRRGDIDTAYQFASAAHASPLCLGRPLQFLKSMSRRRTGKPRWRARYQRELDRQNDERPATRRAHNSDRA